MGGLETLVKKNPLIRQFKTLKFIDAIADVSDQAEVAQDRNRKRRLYDLFVEAHGEDLVGIDVSYTSAINANAYQSLSERFEDVRVSNYVYDPAEIGNSDHDQSIITHYTIGRDGELNNVVDFDDASTKLIQHWINKDPPPVVNTIIVPHHGSRGNRFETLLGDRQRFGVQRAVITVNTQNQYRHPAPEVLLSLFESLGAANVQVTGSDIGGNVSLVDNGVSSVATEHRTRLLSFLDAQIEQYKSDFKSYVDRAYQAWPKTTPDLSDEEHKQIARLQRGYPSSLPIPLQSEIADFEPNDHRRNDDLDHDMALLKAVFGSPPSSLGAKKSAGLPTDSLLGSDASFVSFRAYVPPEIIWIRAEKFLNEYREYERELSNCRRGQRLEDTLSISNGCDRISPPYKSNPWPHGPIASRKKFNTDFNSEQLPGWRDSNWRDLMEGGNVGSLASPSTVEIDEAHKSALAETRRAIRGASTSFEGITLLERARALVNRQLAPPRPIQEPEPRVWWSGAANAFGGFFRFLADNPEKLLLIVFFLGFTVSRLFKDVGSAGRPSSGASASYNSGSVSGSRGGQRAIGAKRS